MLDVSTETTSLRDGRSLAEVFREALSDVPGRARRIGSGATGCWSYVVRVGDALVKCYECLSAEQADRVRLASGILRSASVSVPRVLAVSGHVVVAEWVNGRSLRGKAKRRVFRQVAEYQRRIHGAPVVDIPPGFGVQPYLPWLSERLSMYGGHVLPRQTVEETSEWLRRLLPSDLQVRITHPDLATRNIVRNADGQLVVVDNEFLGVGRAFELDILTCAKRLFPRDEKMQAEYIGTYGPPGQCGTLFSHRHVWEACWQLWSVGLLFYKGKTDEALQLLSAVRDKMGA